MNPDQTLPESQSTPPPMSTEGGEAHTLAPADTPLLNDARFEGLVPILIGAAFLSFLLRRISRSGAARRLRRWLPLLYTGVWGSAFLMITGIYAQGLTTEWFVGVWILLLVVAFASIGWLRSVMAGVALSIEGRIRIGDSIRLGGVEGEVVSFGMRAVRLRAVDGTIHDIPNEKLVTESVANLTGDGGDSACELTIAIPPTIDPDDALDLGRNIAVLTPLASPRHRPEVFLIARHDEEQRYDLRVRGYAFDALYQDHYRSDVVSRLQAAFAKLTHNRDGTHDPANARILAAED